MFTNDEMNLMCIYNTGSREKMLSTLHAVRQHLEADEVELLQLTDSTIEKLTNLSDEAFEALELVPDFK
ncbi:MAG: transposon-transfer assisting family protein [Oscillospiraceae bacterium]|nr:transposon-transfer assisting family protein [Oscillospiraceae bacterium]